MIPGPDQIIECPNCGALAKYATLESGNTFGSKIWTDGKREAPMLPEPPAVGKCRGCSGYFWVADAAEVGTIEFASSETVDAPSEWRSAEDIQELDEEQYYDAIRSGLARDREEERRLRILAW